MTSNRAAQVNWKALIALAMVFCLGAVAAYFVHGYRVRVAVHRALTTGNTAYDQRDFTKAATQLGRYLAAHPADTAILFKYADAQLRRRPQSGSNIEQAVNALEQILRQNPAEAEAAGKLVDLYLLTQDKVGARRIAEAWYSAASTEPLARRALVKALIAQARDDQNAKALERIREWRTAAPDEPYLLRLEASVFLVQNQVEQARASLEHLIAKHPEDIEGAADLAWLLWRQEEKTQAEAVLDRAVDHSPQSAEARIARGRFRLLAEKRDQARSDLEEAVRLAGGDIRVLLSAGSLLADAGFIEAAGVAFDEAAKIEPHNAAIYQAHAAAVLEAGAVEAGIALADRALAAPLGEQRFDVLEPAAELYAAANRPADVRKCLDELRAIAPKAGTILYIEGMMAMADARVYEAIDLFEQAIQSNRGMARAHLLLSRCLRQAGNTRRSVGPLREYIRLRQEAGRPVATSQVELARLYASLGRYREAAEVASEISLTGLGQKAFNTAILAKIELMAQAARPEGAKPDPAMIKRIGDEVATYAAQYPQATAIRVLDAKLTAWRGDKSGAVSTLRALRAGTPDKLAVSTALIDLLAEAKEYDEAIDECKAALGVDGLEQDQIAALQARMAGLHAEAGRTAEARKLFEEAIAAAQGSARSPLRLALARLLLREGQREPAREILVQIVKEDDKDISSRLLLLSLEPVEGKWPDRQTLADQIKSIEGRAGINWRYAQAVADLNPPIPPENWKAYPQTKAIETLLNECLAKDEEWEAPALALGSLYERMAEYEKAVDVYRKAFPVNPDSFARKLAATAARAGRWDDADSALRALPADDPLSQELQLVRAIRHGDRSQAISVLRQAVIGDMDGKNVAARLKLWALLRDKGEIEEAQQLLDEAARIAPESPEVLAARVQTHLGRAEFDSALDLCTQAVAHSPTQSSYQLLAQVYEAKGDLAAAEVELRKMASLKDATETGFLMLGGMYHRNGSAAKAMECWREGLAASPKSDSLRLAVAEALLSSGKGDQIEESIRILDEIIAEQPGNLLALLLRADGFHRTNAAKGDEELDRIEKQNREVPMILRRRIQFASRNAEANEAKGLSTKARIERNRAIELIDRALRSEPRDTGLLLTKSGLLLVNDDLTLAAAVARQAMDIEPSNEAALLAYIRAMTVRKEAAGPREMETALQVALAFLARPDTARAVNARLAAADLCLALASGDAERLRQADELIRQATTIPSDSTAPVAARLRWYAAAKEWANLLSAAKAHLSVKPDDVNIANAAGLLLLDSGEATWREASLDMLRIALDRRPLEPQSYLNLAVALNKLNRAAEAMKVLQQGLQTLPGSTILLMALGSVSHGAGQYADAVNAYRQALDAEPDNYLVLNDLSYVLCENLHDPQQAEKLAKKAIDAGVENASLWDTWGVILYRLGRHEDSRAALEKALADPRILPQTRQSATFHLARTLVHMDPVRSRELLDRLLAIPPDKRWMSPAEFAEAQALREGTTASRPLSGPSAEPGMAGEPR